MEERQVTIDGKTFALELPFFVIATQNPVETAGTFPLPEAQMDRFMMRLSMGEVTREEEIAILETYCHADPIMELQPVITREELLAMKEEAARVSVHPLIAGYMADIAASTRKQEKVVMGGSPRGTLALMRACKAWAYMDGREYCIPDDVKALAPSVLAHRLAFSYGGGGRKDAEGLIEEIPADRSGSGGGFRRERIEDADSMDMCGSGGVLFPSNMDLCPVLEERPVRQAVFFQGKRDGRGRMLSGGAGGKWKAASPSCAEGEISGIKKAAFFRRRRQCGVRSVLPQ